MKHFQFSLFQFSDYQNLFIMVKPEKTSQLAAPSKTTMHQSLPSPALCCACSLCIMLAGVNITLVGAFGTFIPTGNVPIVVGPLLLLTAVAFFTVCCVVSRRTPAHKAEGGENLRLVRIGKFEVETSEHTLQDTTAVQLSPTNSPTSSQKSCSSQGAPAAPAGCQGAWSQRAAR